MEDSAGPCHLAPLLREEVYVSKHLITDCLERLIRPWHEPVDGAAVHQGWKVSDPVSQCAANWAHSKNDMEMGSRSLYKEVFKLFLST